MFQPLSFCATNIRHTKPHDLGYKQSIYQTMCPHSCTRSTACTKPCAHSRPINCNIIPQKNTMIPYMAQPRYHFNSQVLAIFIPSTIPTMPHYPESTDRYFPQYSRLSFSLYFMTRNLFLDFPCPTSASFLNHTTGPILWIPPSLTPLTEF